MRAFGLRSCCALVSCLSLVLSCGAASRSSPASSKAAPAPTTNPRTAAPASVRPRDVETLPATCAAPGAEVCTPPAAFVERLCGGSYPDIALRMFAKGTPWTRGYLRGNVVAWNASGGASSNDKLVFDEEVIIVRHRAAPRSGGISVSGAGASYDVVRWDGTCASLSSGELTLRPPPNAKAARIPWKSLELGTREALLADEKIGKTDADRRKECKGATMGSVSAECREADAKLSVAIVEYLRAGGAVPPPGKLP